MHEISIEPPDANVWTDDDSGREFPKNLSVRQLLLQSELMIRSAVIVHEAKPEVLVPPAVGSDSNDVFMRPGSKK